MGLNLQNMELIGSICKNTTFSRLFSSHGAPCEPKFYTFLSQKMAVPLPVAQAPPVIERFRTFFPTRTTLHPKATCCRTNFACSLQPHKEKLRTNSVVCLSASTSSPGTNPIHCLFCKTIWISFISLSYFSLKMLL